jgi:hypothetical protein
MLERAQEATRFGKYTAIEYARFADALVILIDAHVRHDRLLQAVEKPLREEIAALRVGINEEKSRIVDRSRDESFGLLGSIFATFVVDGVSGVRNSCRSSRNERHCCGSSRMCFALPIATSCPDRAKRSGELLRGRALKRVLQLDQRLGG